MNGVHTGTLKIGDSFFNRNDPRRGAPSGRRAFIAIGGMGVSTPINDS